jgi:hypothetical protein
VRYANAALDYAARYMETIKENFEAIVRQVYERQFEAPQRKFYDRSAQMEDRSHKMFEGATFRIAALRQQIGEQKQKADSRPAVFSKLRGCFRKVVTSP